MIKGAASALYGTAALGGVINLVSRGPDVRERIALANATTLGGTDLSLWIAEPAQSRWGWTVLGGLPGQRRVDLDEDGCQPDQVPPAPPRRTLSECRLAS